MNYKVIIIFITIIILSGCASTKDFILVATPSKSPARLAILPINNFTNDVAGSIVFRKIIYNTLKNKNLGYKIQTLTVTDKLLNNAGITDGGQLNVVKPIELSELLGVDGLLYIDLNELKLLTYPYYHTRNVKGTFYLYNFEKLIWDKPIRVTTKYFGVKSALDTVQGVATQDKDLIDKGIGEAGVDILIHQGIKYATIAGFKHPLAPEMALVSNKLSQVMPMGSDDDSNYVKQSERRIQFLKKQVKNRKSIVTNEMYNIKKEPVPVLEQLIPLFN